MAGKTSKSKKKVPSMAEALGVMVPETAMSRASKRIYTKFAETKDGKKLFIDLAFDIVVKTGAAIETTMTVRTAKTTGSFKNFGSRGDFGEGLEYGQKFPITLPTLTGKSSMVEVLKEGQVVEKIHAWLSASAAVTGGVVTFTEDQLLEQMLSFLDTGEPVSEFKVPEVLTGDGPVSKPVLSKGDFIDHDDDDDGDYEEEEEDED